MVRVGLIQKFIKSLDKSAEIKLVPGKLAMTVKLSNGAEMSIIWGTHALVDIGQDGRAKNCEARCWGADGKVFHEEDFSGMDGNMARLATGDIVYIASELLAAKPRCSWLMDNVKSALSWTNT
jgi:hypothetical protein